MAAPIVQVRDVSKRFSRDGFEVVALDHVNFELNAGDFFALMGPSGSGKSTLLNLLAGMTARQKAKLRLWDTVDQTQRKSAGSLAHAHIGYIFQTFNLVPVLTAFENVELPLLLTKLSKAERRKNVETSLELVGLSDRMHHQPRQLSADRNSGWRSLEP